MWRLIPYWDVKHKKINKKHFLLELMLTEFEWGNFGLGFEWYLNRRFAMFSRNGSKHARLIIHVGWVEVFITLYFGNKAQNEAAWKRLRESQEALVAQHRLNVVN